MESKNSVLYQFTWHAYQESGVVVYVMLLVQWQCANHAEATNFVN